MTVSQIKSPGQGSRYIAMEGPIGVGKTALAKRLAESMSADLVLEEVEENPFLERFYREGKSAALPAQMFFPVRTGAPDRGDAPVGPVFRCEDFRLPFHQATVCSPS